jgi:hypothetical protein
LFENNPIRVADNGNGELVEDDNEAIISVLLWRVIKIDVFLCK